MELDSFLQIGYSHNICEDYIRHGNRKNECQPNSPYIVLSDGCSSAPHTDIGSRLLVLEKIRHMDSVSVIDDKIFMNVIMEKAKMFDLSINNFFATLLSLELDGCDNHFKAEMKGDGFIISRKRTGEIEIYKREFKSGAPYYPAYQYKEHMTKGYFENFNDVIIDTKLIIKDGVRVSDDVNNSIKASIEPFRVEFSADDYDLVAISSDGLNSFKKRSVPNEEIKLEYIVNQFMGFKHIKGEFVKRRLEKAVYEMRKEGIDHYDDISFGAIYTGS